MDEKLSRLMNNKLFLAEQISGKLTELLPMLLKHGLITKNKLEKVRRHRFESEQSIELLSNLLIKDNDSYRIFIDCLRGLNINKAATVLISAGVTLIVRVHLKKTSQSVEVKLVQHLNNIKTFNGPNKESVNKYIGWLKESDIDILEAVQQKDSCLAIWLWCCSSYGVKQLTSMLSDRSSSKTDLTHLFSKLFNHVLYVKKRSFLGFGFGSEDTVDIRGIDFDEEQILGKTFDEPLDRIDRTDVVDLINCTICMDPFEDPRALPCQHTFCLKCLKGMGSESVPGDELKCPMCRATYVHPKEGLHKLPSNIYAKKVQQRLFNDSKPDTSSTPFAKSCNVEIHATSSPTVNSPEYTREAFERISPSHHQIPVTISARLPSPGQRLISNGKLDTSSTASTKSCNADIPASVSPTVNPPYHTPLSFNASKSQQTMASDCNSDTLSTPFANSCNVEIPATSSPTVNSLEHTREAFERISPSQQQIPVTISARTLTSNAVEKIGTHPVMDILEMNDFYVRKVTLMDIFTIENKDDMRHKCLNVAKNLMKLNCKAPLTVISTKNIPIQNSVVDESQSKVGKNKFLARKSVGTQKKEFNVVHPMDVMNVIFNCCDNILLQALMTKLFMCQLAIPLIFPNPNMNSSTFLLWALREIVSEIKVDQKVVSPIVEIPLPVVSFMRIGNLKSSKSKLLNNILRSTDHNTFFHRDCENGTLRRIISNGTVEATWFQPFKTSKTGLTEMFCILNLRGDSIDFPDLSYILCKQSSLNFIMLNVESLSNKLYENFFEACANLETQFVVCFMAGSAEEGNKHEDDCVACSDWLEKHLKNYDVITNWNEDRLLNAHDWKREIENAIAANLKEYTQRITIEKLSCFVRERTEIRIDENDIDCSDAKNVVHEITLPLHTIKPEERKKRAFPLHGEIWKKWTLLEKKRNREHVSNNSIETYISEKEVEQQQIRISQVELFMKGLPFTNKILESLVSCINDTKKQYIVRNLKLTFDNWSREIMPILAVEYHEKSMECRKLVSESKNDPHIETISKQIDDIIKMMADASLGVEHLCREIGQLYEAYVTAHQSQTRTIKLNLLVAQLPLLVANLLIQGMSLEIMDGDTSFVPKTWIKAVFDETERIIGAEKKVYVVSAVGIQSSGKSTFLNTMFGLQFATSAGRCTRGVFCQLIPVDKQSMDVDYDYILVVDTEGLRAPELQNVSKVHDNELATFVIGLGNVTVVNIKGENSAELQDILQIVIHALLRMKVLSKVKMSPSCVFVHQNVAAVNAEEELKFGQENLLKQLDEVTLAAAQQEHIDDEICQFKQIIEYDEYKHAVYLPDLWEGVPPMAPVSSVYSEQVGTIRNMLIRDISKKTGSITIGSFSEKISDLWNSIICENFVFSFRNSEEVKLYSQLDATFSQLLFDFKTEIMSLQSTLAAKILSAEGGDLDDLYKLQKLQINKSLSDTYNELGNHLKVFFEEHPKKDILEQWKGRYLHNLESFRNDEETSLKRDVENKMNIRKKQLANTVKAEEYRHDMIQKTTKTARDLKLRGQLLSDENLRLAFEEMWILWESDFSKMLEKNNFVQKITDAIENELGLLFNAHLNILKDEIQKSPWNEMNDLTFDDSFKVIKADLDRIKLRKFEGFKDKIKHLNQSNFSKRCKKEAESECHKTVMKISSYVTKLSGHDFQPGQVAQITQMIKDFFKNIDAKKNQSGYNFQHEFQIRFAIHVCKCAANEFLKFSKEFQLKTDPFFHLQEFKQSLSILFRNTYNDISREEYAANVFATSFTAWMKDKIESDLCALIANGICNEGRSFKIFQSKQSFISTILRDLGEKKDFSEYIEYLDNPELYFNNQIHNYEQLLTKKRSAKQDSNHSFRDKIVEREVNNYTAILLGSIDSIKKLPISSLSDYLTKLNAEIKSRMFCPNYQGRFLESMEVRDFEKLTQYFSEAILKCQPNVIESIKASHEASSNEKLTVDLLADRILGCPEKCPFCSSPCCLTEKNHEGDHRALHHYPFGIKGMNEAGSDKLCMYNCQSVVDSNMWFCPDFVNPDSKEYFKNYRNYHPRWEILPDRSMKSSLYWKWFIVKFHKELAEHFKKDLGDIPNEWHQITWDKAKMSLKMK